MASIENQILSGLQTILLTLSWPKQVEFEFIKTSVTDFREHELPAIQFYFPTMAYAPLQGRSDTDGTIIVEIIMRKSSTDLVNQGLLLDRLDEVLQKVGANPQLGLTSLPATEGSFKRIDPFAGSTALHIEDPFYTGSLTFIADYFRPFSGIC